MASVVLTLPTGLVFMFTVPDGGQVCPVTIRECACGCEEWFVPRDPKQIYFSDEHQQQQKNIQRRKTTRRSPTPSRPQSGRE